MFLGKQVFGNIYGHKVPNRAFYHCLNCFDAVFEL